jgi:hypothetical protein
MSQTVKNQFYLFFLTIGALLCGNVVAMAQDPNDTKTGSVLFFNRYTSNASNPGSEDTQLNLTNTSQTSSVTLHLFAVESSSCSVADSFISLTPNQTAQFFASDFDPGVQGYLVAVAYSGGAPRQFNFLTGTAYIRQADGKTADLPAVAVPKRNNYVYSNGNGTVNLVFDGVNYGQLPGTVAISNFNSQATDRTSLYLYSPRDLIFGDNSSVSIFALMYNELEAVGSTSFAIRCYSEVRLANLRIIGTINGFIPAGSVGWMKMSASRPLLGASLSSGPRFSGGRNLTCLSLFSSWTIVVPGGF